VKRTRYEAPHYAVFSSLLPLPPTFSTAPCSQTPKVSLLPLLNLVTNGYAVMSLDYFSATKYDFLTQVFVMKFSVLSQYFLTSILG